MVLLTISSVVQSPSCYSTSYLSGVAGLPTGVVCLSGIFRVGVTDFPHFSYCCHGPDHHDDMLAVCYWLWLILYRHQTVSLQASSWCLTSSLLLCECVCVQSRETFDKVNQVILDQQNPTKGQGWDERNPLCTYKNMPQRVNLLRWYLWDVSRSGGPHSSWRRRLSLDPPPAFWSHLLLL